VLAHGIRVPFFFFLTPPVQSTGGVRKKECFVGSEAVQKMLLAAAFPVLRTGNAAASNKDM